VGLKEEKEEEKEEEEEEEEGEEGVGRGTGRLWMNSRSFSRVRDTRRLRRPRDGKG